MSISEPTHPVISDVALDVGHLGIYFSTNPDSAPELCILDGASSITVGSPETVRALAAALTSVTSPRTAEGTQVRPAPSDAQERDGYAAALAEAQATDCGIPGCDRKLHDPSDDPSEWVHRIARRQHFGMDVDLCVEPGGVALASLFLKTENSFNAEGLRTFATTLQLQAAALLEDADILEQHARRVQER